MTVFLGGDVMTGRGVDQILERPADPRLREPSVLDAREYVRLAEAANGPISRPVDGAWLWGDALPLLEAADPDVRLINLETSVTADGEHHPGKSIHYRMHPANIGCLTVARPDVCVLANNHVLDFGRPGLADTLDALAGAGLGAVGAGRDEAAAHRPAVIPLAGGGRVLVFAAGAASAGIPPDWAAGPGLPGVAYLPSASGAGVENLARRVSEMKSPGDLVIVSLHWGPNWGYEVGPEETALAHLLIDAGADLIHGHSSHHPRPVEVHRGKLILYGCGDFIDDYEGIRGYEQYRDDLRLAWLATLDARTGALAGLRAAPLRARRMRLQRASVEDSAWLAATLAGICRPFGVGVEPGADGFLLLRASRPS